MQGKTNTDICWCELLKKNHKENIENNNRCVLLVYIVWYENYIMHIEIYIA